MRCDLVKQQNINEWLKLGLGSNLIFWVVKTRDGAIIDMTCGFESEIACISTTPLGNKPLFKTMHYKFIKPNGVNIPQQQPKTL